jgi:hypothetical protein
MLQLLNVTSIVVGKKATMQRRHRSSLQEKQCDCLGQRYSAMTHMLSSHEAQGDGGLSI